MSVRTPARSRVAIGVPVHNSASFLRGALDGLLAQTFADFQVLVLDDGSTDASPTIIQEYVGKDPRVHQVRLEARTGMVEAWRESARLAGEMFQPELFAWHSDHDLVAPDWLGQLVAALDSAPDVVMAHARTILIDLDGTETGEVAAYMDTRGLPDLDRLEKAIFSKMGAGDAVYGLFRWPVLAECGIFHDEILPDRLVVAEANLHGGVARVEGAVRYRRQTTGPMTPEEIVERQLRTLFPEGRVKESPYTSHATFFLRKAEEAAAAPADLSSNLARRYLGFIYCQRSLQKFREALEAELARDGSALSLLAQTVAVARGAMRELGDRLDAFPATVIAAEGELAAERTQLQIVGEARERLEQELAAVSGARDALQGELREARSLAEALEGRIEALTAALEKEREERTQFKTELVAARMTVKELTKARRHADGKVAGMRDALHRVVESLRAETSSRVAAEMAVAGTNESLQRATDALQRETALRTQAEADLEAVRGELLRAQEVSDGVARECADARTALSALAETKSLLEEQLADARTAFATLAETKTLLEEQLADVRSSADRAREEAQALAVQLEGVTTSRDGATAEVARTREELRELREEHFALERERLRLEHDIALMQRDHRELSRRYRFVRVLGVFGAVGLRAADRVSRRRRPSAPSTTL